MTTERKQHKDEFWLYKGNGGKNKNNSNFLFSFFNFCKLFFSVLLVYSYFLLQSVAGTIA